METFIHQLSLTASHGLCRVIEKFKGENHSNLSSREVTSRTGKRQSREGHDWEGIFRRNSMILTEEVISRLTGLATLPTITHTLTWSLPSSTHFSHICITNLYRFFKSLLNFYFINKAYFDQPTKF